MPNRKRRPVFFNLVQIQMPVGALTSITHRVSGILLAIGTPLSIYVFALSMQGPQSFARAAGLLDPWPVKVVMVLFVWALAHHTMAGVRHLLSDIDIGSKLADARRSAWTVNVGAILVTIFAAAALA